MKRVSSIQKTQVVACGKGNTLVHSIIYPIITLADDMRKPDTARFCLINCPILRTSVNENAFVISIRLLLDTLECSSYDLASVKCYRYYGELRS